MKLLPCLRCAGFLVFSPKSGLWTHSPRIARLFGPGCKAVGV